MFRAMMLCGLVLGWLGTTQAQGVLSPGTGWTGATAQPAAIGSGTGADKYAIAHWDMVPFQTFAGTINVGVLAYHFNDMDSVCFSVNKGPWRAVRQPSLNPETGAEEYWVTLDATLFAKDTVAEVRAIAYPKIGIPKVLQGKPLHQNSSMLLNANSHGTLPHAVRYVSVTGNDTYNGQTPAQAVRTVKRAIEAACTGGSAGGSVDGAEIRLGEGSWSLPDLGGWGKPVFATTNQWLTFSSAPGADPARVFVTGIDGPSDGGGLNTKLIHFYNLTMHGSIDKTPATSLEDYIWFDHDRIIDPSPTAISSGDCWQVTGVGSIWSGGYITDCYYNNTCNGPRDVTLARNVYADSTGDGHSSGTATVINYTVNFVYGSTYKAGWPDFHGDIYQMYGRYSNIIIYGARTTPGGRRSMRGIVSGNSPVSDVAMANCDIDLGGQWAFSYYQPINHMVVKNCRFIGSGNWYAELGGSPNPANMLNILIDHSVFENGNAYKVPYPYALPGIRYIPALGTSLGAPAMPINFQAVAVSTTQVRLTWNDVVNESGYKLERSADGVSGWTQVNAPIVNIVSYTNGSLTANTTYYYRLRAWNSSGDGAWSAVVSATTTATGIFDRAVGKTAQMVPLSAMVIVYDMTGRGVMTGDQSAMYKQLPRGMYFIKTGTRIFKTLILN